MEIPVVEGVPSEGRVRLLVFIKKDFETRMNVYNPQMFQHRAKHTISNILTKCLVLIQQIINQALRNGFAGSVVNYTIRVTCLGDGVDSQLDSSMSLEPI